ncbi:MAG: Gfo/Idh/MocA family oxidoreductase [Chloroflexi bacterium]|nr:Gfo/Idh/MocA family oxidoreductase [Chloroflexota bacterium]
MIQLAVIGAGYWGPNLVRNFSQTPGARVAYVCDLDAAKLAPLAAQYPTLTTTRNYQDALGDPNVDAVVVATPVSTHQRLAVEALRAGKHVLVEKPLAATVQAAREIDAVAREVKRVLMVGHTFIYNPAVTKVHEYIQRGALGEIYYIDSARVNLGLHQFDINVIWDLAPHDVSMILYWLGQRPLRVSARGNSYTQDNIEDVAFVTLEFPGKVMAHIHVSWMSPAKLRRTTIVGSKQMIVYDDLEAAEKVKLYDSGVEQLALNATTRAELQRTYRVGDVLSPRLDVVEPLRVECKHFVECIVEGKTPRTNGDAGIAVVQVLEAATRSLREGGRTIEIGS